MSGDYKIVLKRGTEKDLLNDKSLLILGEVAYLTDKRKIVVGNPESDTGFDIVSSVTLGPHDGNFYARLEGYEKYIPVGMNIRKQLNSLVSNSFSGFMQNIKKIKDKGLVPFNMPNWREHL